jgi:hypothetical protein
MSKVAIVGDNLGTGTFTLKAPNGNTDRVLDLPDEAGTLATAESTLTQFNASGSAPVYACRAWVNFDGTTATPSTIRGSGNVSSITRLVTGRFEINLTTSLPDENYSVIYSSTSGINNNAQATGAFIEANTAATIFMNTATSNAQTLTNFPFNFVAVFR